MHIWLVSFALFACHPTVPEQAAFDYFSTEVFPRNYPLEKRAYLSGYTENDKAVTGLFSRCTAWVELRPFYDKQQNRVEQLPIEWHRLGAFRKSRTPRGHRLFLRIYRSIEIDGVAYTYLKAYKAKHFVDHYLVKQDLKNDSIFIACRTQETI